MRAASKPDLIVVGGGIAGCEAAWRAAERGLDVLVVTTSLDTIYQLAHETALLDPVPGTLMARLIPAIANGFGEVAASDLHRAAKYTMEAHERLHLLQSTASGLLVDAGAVSGVRTWEGVDRRACAVALCVGSFLRARLTVGAVVEQQGRLSEMAYDDLYEDLAARGFEFEELTLSLPSMAGSLPYAVTTLTLAAGEAIGASEPGSPAAGDVLRLRRLQGLWAAGVCAPAVAAARAAVGAAAPAAPGYEESAAAGLALGDAVHSDLAGRE